MKHAALVVAMAVTCVAVAAANVALAQAVAEFRARA